MDVRKPKKCEMCDATFTRNYNLLNHVKETHNSLKLIIKCHMCGKKFNDKNDLTEHYKTHPTNNGFSLYNSAFKKSLKIMSKNLQIPSSGDMIFKKLALIFINVKIFCRP